VGFWDSGRERGNSHIEKRLENLGDNRSTAKKKLTTKDLILFFHGTQPLDFLDSLLYVNHISRISTFTFSKSCEPAPTTFSDSDCCFELPYMFQNF
jgi:hypothetical protein